MSINLLARYAIAMKYDFLKVNLLYSVLQGEKWIKSFHELFQAALNLFLINILKL